MTTLTRQLGAGITKQTRAHVVKAAGQSGSDLRPGQFSAIVSVFGNRDSYGDVMMPGAFVATLADYRARGVPVPVLWSHDWQDPQSHIGEVLEAEEVTAGKLAPDSPPGLWVLGQNDIEVNSRAAYVSRLMAGGRITQFSFAYDEINAGWGMYDGEESWLIHEVAIHEVGPTLLGANRETALIGAKHTIIDLARRRAAGAKLDQGDERLIVALRSLLVADAPPAVEAVPSTQTSTTEGQDSTDETTDRAADGGQASNLRTADSGLGMLVDLAVAEAAAID